MKILCKLFGHKWPYMTAVLQVMGAIEAKNGLPCQTIIKCLRGCGATRDLTEEAVKTSLNNLQQPKEFSMAQMTLREAIDKFREYWPDTTNVMWGEAFEVICAKAMESALSVASSAMVPCPKYKKDWHCCFGFHCRCGFNPCMVLR